MAVLGGVGVVQGLAAHRAQAGAVGPAEDLRRRIEDEGIPRPGAQVEDLRLHIGARELLVAEPRLVDFPRIDVDLGARTGKAAGARAGERRVEAQAEGVARAGPREVESVGHRPVLDRMIDPAQARRIELKLALQPPSLPGTEGEIGKVDVILPRHGSGSRG